jgi:hypothetical protein
MEARSIKMHIKQCIHAQFSLSLVIHGLDFWGRGRKEEHKKGRADQN